jgi:flagellar hook-basal body complex protein FliE
MTPNSIAAAVYAANQDIPKETLMPTNSFAAAASAANQSLASGVRRPDGAGATEGQSFGALLSGAVGSVAEAGKAAEAQALAAAGGRADIVDVVTAVAESEAALETLVAVRDRVIAAYEDIMRMPI